MKISNKLVYRKLLIVEKYLTKIFDENFDKKRCPVCNEEIRIYVPYPVSPLIKLPTNNPSCCPNCWALPRHRLLALYMAPPSQSRLLHFAPEGFFNKFQKMNGKNGFEYFPVDLNPHNDLVRREDIQCLSFEDDFFDTIICSHVLEHVEDDRKAISELFRVLKPGGVAYIMIPRNNNQGVDVWSTLPKLEKTLEKPYINTEELRTAMYGQYDHVRLYAEDFVDRLKQFDVEVVTAENYLSEEQISIHELWSHCTDEIYVCRKPK